MNRNKKGYGVLILLLAASLSLGGCAAQELLWQITDTIFEQDAPEEPASANAAQTGEMLPAESGEGGRNEGSAGTGETAEGGETAGSQDAGSQAQELKEPAEESADTEQPEESTDTEQSEGISTEGPVVSQPENITFYAYGTLSEKEKLWYDNMVEGLSSMEDVHLAKKALEGGLNEKDIDRIFQYVMCDHPEFFYVDGYHYTKYLRGTQTVGYVFAGSYNLNEIQARSRASRIEKAAEEWLADIPEELSEYERVKYVYESLIDRTDYDLESEDNQNIYSVFINHRSVCQGYAKATQYLLQRLGIECTLVQGNVDTGEAHAWNLIKVDGSYYYVDTTWGDVAYHTDSGGNFHSDSISYDYLCITTEQLLRTHTLGGEIPMPECTDTAANYYVREDALFETYDKEKLAQLFRRAKELDMEALTIKCADKPCMDIMEQRLLDEQEIFDYLPDGEWTISYASNEKQLSLTFWLK